MGVVTEYWSSNVFMHQRLSVWNEGNFKLERLVFQPIKKTLYSICDFSHLYHPNIIENRIHNAETDSRLYIQPARATRQYSRNHSSVVYDSYHGLLHHHAHFAETKITQFRLLSPFGNHSHIRIWDISDSPREFQLVFSIFGMLFLPQYEKNSQIGIWIISIVITAYMSIFIIDWETILQYNNWINRLFHDILGLTIILTGIRLSFILKMTTIPKVLSIIDKHSFPIYITHHVFLLGPIAIIHARWGAYITLIITILTAHLLNITSNKITKIITKRI